MVRSMKVASTLNCIALSPEPSARISQPFFDATPSEGETAQPPAEVWPRLQCLTNIAFFRAQLEIFWGSYVFYRI